MTVKELIERLKECDSGMEVWACLSTGGYGYDKTVTEVGIVAYQGSGPNVVELR